jgi:lysyl-tRNA synthetase class 2
MPVIPHIPPNPTCPSHLNVDSFRPNRLCPEAIICYVHPFYRKRERIVASNPLAEIRNIRLGKVQALRDLGLNPFPSKSRRTHYAGALTSEFATYEGQTATVAGRLMSWRKQGGLAFGHVQDQTGRIQLFLKKQSVQGLSKEAGTIGFPEFNLLDLGDIVEATGKVMKTERGEISIMVDSFAIIGKSLRPLPDQWSGLKDREIILRKRYLDVILEEQSQKRFAATTKMVAAIRTFLNDRGFMEFQTPVIQPQYGGGTAKPFKTHVNALGCEMYLAISHELYLKRLIVAGYDKVYTIGRYFRNEGIDRSHHPEFSMVETMTAYENYEYNMNLIEEMFRFVAKTAFGKTHFHVRGHVIDFENPWRRVSMADAVKEKTGVDFRELKTVEETHEVLRGLKADELPPSIGEALVKAFELAVEPTLIEPTLVYGHPVEISPLAKPMASDPRFAERFEIFIAGMECGDNWSEQNDPAHLLATWKKAYKPEERDSGEFHALDFDFIEALEYGMPPTTGIGPGVERMAMIFTEQENIDDVIFFPMLKPAVSAFNADVYGIEEQTTGPVDDLTLSFDQFENLIKQDGALLPKRATLVIHPRIRLWPSAQKGQPWHVTGFVEIEGVFANGILRLAGYEGLSTKPGEEKEHQQKMGLRASEILLNAWKTRVTDLSTRIAMPPDQA